MNTSIVYLNNFYWRCFLVLEKYFLSTLETVEFDKKNYSTFSIKYRSIIFQACSEIETLCKLICNIPLEEKGDMLKYRNYINENHKGFHSNIVLVLLHNLELQPWLSLENNESPTFWTAYQAIKHQGKLEEATFKNALDSLAGLFSILLAWYCKSVNRNFSDSDNIEQPKLFTFPDLKALLLATETKGVEIKGFTDKH